MAPRLWSRTYLLSHSGDLHIHPFHPICSDPVCAMFSILWSRIGGCGWFMAKSTTLVQACFSQKHPWSPRRPEENVQHRLLSRMHLLTYVLLFPLKETSFAPQFPASPWRKGCPGFLDILPFGLQTESFSIFVAMPFIISSTGHLSWECFFLYL